MLVRWLLSLFRRSSAELMRENRLLRLRLEAAEETIKLLAQHAENSRRWLIASTAAAVSVAKLHGVEIDEEEKRAGDDWTSERMKRNGATPKINTL